MTEDQFIEIFREQHGFAPTQEIIDEYLGSNSGSRFSRERNGYRRYSRGSEDLFFELKDITSSIADIAYQNKEALEESSEKVSQFGYMVWIFLAKSVLYFLFQSSLERGFDFRHM
jgi:hypothetical protein